jgi:DNA polymerase-3 subunit delta'
MWRTIGHDKAVTTLKRALGEGRSAHAYLVAGPEHTGKMTLALDLARAVNCSDVEKPCGACDQCRRVEEGLHADVRVVGVESGQAEGGRRRVAIGIDQVRDVQRDASLKPYEGLSRVFIFDGAERLTEEAANSLLKTLEEPPDQVMLVLLASDASAVLPTILSRCHLIELRPVAAPRVAAELEARFALDNAAAMEIARMSTGRIGWAFRAAESPELLEERSQRLAQFEIAVEGGLEPRFAFAAGLLPVLGASRDRARSELTLWIEWWRDVMAINHGCPELVTNLSRRASLEPRAKALSSAQITSAIRAIQQTLENIERNVNLRLALENLMLRLP